MVGIAGRTITFRHADGSVPPVPDQPGRRRWNSSPLTARTRAQAPEHAPGERPETRGARRNRAGRTNRSKRSTLETPAHDQTFSAIVEQDVTDASGRVIIPDSSSAQLVIRELSSGGATGSPEMVLDVHSITVDGRRYLVSTTDLTRGQRHGASAPTSAQQRRSVGAPRSARSSAPSRAAGRAR